MKASRTDRGFQIIEHPQYPDPDGPNARLVQSSSVALYDLYDDALDRPGTSALWIGNQHHLNRDEVRELVGYLNNWLETGKLHQGEPADEHGGAQ